MKVNFNNLRKQALFSYHRLTVKLNEAIESDEVDGRIDIDPDDIQQEMDDLRSYLFSIALTYKEGNEGFKDVSEESEPIAWFNEEKELQT